MTPPPYSPSSNGQAERSVRVLKDLLKKNVTGSFNSRLANVLLVYRSTPQTTTGIAPAVALNNRNYITLKERVNPRYNPSVKSKTIPLFNLGDQVLVLNLRSGPKWYDATIVEKIGANIYGVHVHELDAIWKRHVHQMLRKGNSTDANVPVTHNPPQFLATAHSHVAPAQTRPDVRINNDQNNYDDNIAFPIEIRNDPVPVNHDIIDVRQDNSVSVPSDIVTGPGPSVPVSAPSVPISAPSVPVSAPSVPVNAPSVPVTDQSSVRRSTRTKTPITRFVPGS